MLIALNDKTGSIPSPYPIGSLHIYFGLGKNGYFHSEANYSAITSHNLHLLIHIVFNVVTQQ
jgi:hypothetical protein